MQPSSIAAAHRVERQKVTDAATAQALRLWRLIDPKQLDYGWAAVAPSMLATVSAAQVTAAAQAVPFTDRVVEFYGGAPAAELVPEAFGGVVLSGRELAPELYSAVSTTKQLTGRGLEAGRAFEVAAGYLATLIGSAVQDMGRQADFTLAGARGYTNYVRAVSPGACSRCGILAGKSSYKTAFKRHPRCHCTAFPIAGSASPKGFYASPEDFFDSLSKAEQDRVFTKAGAEAIRNGASPITVVNARRGAYGISYNGHYNITVPTSPRSLQPVTIGVRADGTPLQVFATSEGTTARGVFGRSEIQATGQATKEGRYRRTTTLRLMPEQIMTMAGGNPARLRELLIRYGYIA